MASSKILQRMIDAKETPPKYKSAAWRELVNRIEAEIARQICGGKRRNNRKPEVNGWPCLAPPISGRRNCKKHGGHTPPPGPGHHSFKTGRYSTVLEGTSLQKDYEAARTDPKLLELTDEIAVTSAWVKEKLSKIDVLASDTISNWMRTDRKIKSAIRAIESKKSSVALTELRRLQETVNRGLQNHRDLTEIFEGIEMHRRLVDTERKHRTNEKLSIPAEKAMFMLNVIMLAARNVLTREQAEKLRAEIQLLKTGTQALNKRDGLIYKRDLTALRPKPARPELIDVDDADFEMEPE
jgi:hypothetical protein